MQVIIELNLLLCLIVFGTTATFAQKDEVGLLLAVNNTENRDFELPSLGSVRIGNGLSFEATYARRFADAKLASLHFEIVFVVTPSSEINTSNVFVPRSYSTIFLTPGFKLKLFPGFFITPYLAGGAGYARFSESESLASGELNTGDRVTSKGVYNYGVGVELRVLPFTSLRGEVRNFVSGNPDFNAPILKETQGNVIWAGGIVFRF